MMERAEGTRACIILLNFVSVASFFSAAFARVGKCLVDLQEDEVAVLLPCTTVTCAVVA